ncbi:MAG TPA: endonuclease III [Nannocystaceae bacterium]|nr:endonuclease III [Nannocystaceae bacterium]
MRRRSSSASSPDIHVVLERLHEKHPDARYELDWETPVQLTVATILAAQCTDERVNRVTKTLFVTYPDAQAFASADREELEEALKPTGFYKQKAKTVQEVCAGLVERFGGEVPRSMEELTSLPGIARKTANVILNTAFGIPSGIIVDTHVLRVAPRMGFSSETKPEAIERDLMDIVPQSEWTFFGPAMVLHGRYTCTARAPKCEECVMADLCPKVGVE